MALVSPYISVLILNVNQLNALMKKQSRWMDLKTRPNYMGHLEDSL